MDDVGLDGVPGDGADVEGSGHTGHPAAHCRRVEVAQQAGKMLLSNPGDETWGGCFADDQPAVLLRAVFDRVEHDGLPRIACSGVERRSSRRARAVLQRLDEVFEHAITADQQRWADSEACVEWVRHAVTFPEGSRVL